MGSGGVFGVGGAPGSGDDRGAGGELGIGGTGTGGDWWGTGGDPGEGGIGTGGDGSGGTGTGAAPGTGGLSGCGSGTASGSDVVVDLGSEEQRISGFGASTAWGSTMSESDADLLWSTTTGAGLSLHRIRIAPNGTTGETNIARMATARGARVWASPWSPAAAYKSKSSDSLASKNAMSVADSRFNVSLGAHSVTTFVGTR